MTATDEPIFVEDVAGSARPAAYYLAESRDGLYVPYVLRTPADEGRFPFVFLAYGNGGGGIGWLREWTRTRSPIMERLLAAGVRVRVGTVPHGGRPRLQPRRPAHGRRAPGHGGHEPLAPGVRG